MTAEPQESFWQLAPVAFKSVVELLPDMVFAKDARDLRFVLVNRAGEQLLGIPRDQLLGRNDYDFFPREQADVFIARDREVLAHGTAVEIPSEPIDTPRGRRILHTTKLPILDDLGQPRYLFGISQDITDRVNAEAAARGARAEAERANLAKSEFLSRMSHELRTPLNAVLGFAELLRLDDLTEDQRENVGYIMRAGRHLLDLINEVLDISRIETGRMTLSTEPVALAEVLDEAVGLIAPEARERGLQIDLDGGDDRYVVADRQRLRQVLLNLLSNGVKYNREGGQLAIATVDRPGSLVRLSVSDTGPGIAPENRARLFEPFDRLSAEGGPVEGTGLGLALSKGLVEAMGGRIGVLSTPGEGSTFWIELRAAASPGLSAPSGR